MTTASVLSPRHAVAGAIPWVGRSRWNFGSFHLWGDVPALMPPTTRGSKNNGGSWFNIGSPSQKETGRNPVHEFSGMKVPGFRFDGSGRSFQSASVEGVKVPSEQGRHTDPGKGARFTSRDCGVESGIKCGGDWFNDEQPSISRMTSSKSPARKFASAMIAKIPLPLSRYIARAFKPAAAEAA